MSPKINIPSKDAIKQIRSERVQQLNDSPTLDSHKQQLDRVDIQLNEGVKRAIEQNREKGASSWLNVLPLRDNGFTYNRTVTNLPSKCACGEIFSVNHAMNWKKGGFVSI